jgi:hypothetical protein
MAAVGRLFTTNIAAMLTSVQEAAVAAAAVDGVF